MNIEKYNFIIPSENKLSRKIYKIFREVEKKIRSKEINLQLFKLDELYNYINVYNHNTIGHYVSFFQFLINNNFIIKKSKILDFGCWFGFSSIILNQLNESDIISTDIYPRDKIMSLIECFEDCSVSYLDLKSFLAKFIAI